MLVFLSIGAQFGCSRESKFEKIVGLPVIESRVDKGFRYRREYYVYSKINHNKLDVFDLICEKVSLRFKDDKIYRSGSLEYEKGKYGFPPDITKRFGVVYGDEVIRYYSITSKDGLSVAAAYETKEYVCVILADGS